MFFLLGVGVVLISCKNHVFFRREEKGGDGGVHQNLSSPRWPPTADGRVLSWSRVRNLSWLRTSRVKNVPWQNHLGGNIFGWKWWEEVLFRLGKHKTMEKQTNIFPVPRFGRWHFKAEDSWFIALAIEMSLPTCSMIWLNFMRILWNHLAAGRLAPKNATGWVMNLENGDGAWNCNRLIRTWRIHKNSHR